jgi:hypothetical protein
MKPALRTAFDVWRVLAIRSDDFVLAGFGASNETVIQR